MKKLLIFGDSVEYGAWDVKGGWITRLRYQHDLETTSRGEKYIIYNLGHSNEDVLALKKRMTPEAKVRVSNKDQNIIMLKVGLNDSRRVDGKLVTSDAKFKTTLKSLITEAKKLSDIVIIIGPTLADESRTNPFLHYQISWNNQDILAHDKIIASICKELNVQYISIAEDWVNENYELYLEDGLHPNSEGHKHIFERINEELKPVLKP
ncbi:MAG: GDSL-type esterase/lipase family protein [Candidatus Woesearchaeota archaeon]